MFTNKLVNRITVSCPPFVNSTVASTLFLTRYLSHTSGYVCATCSSCRVCTCVCVKGRRWCTVVLLSKTRPWIFSLSQKNLIDDYLGKDVFEHIQNDFYQIVDNTSLSKGKVDMSNIFFCLKHISLWPKVIHIIV